MKNLLTQYETEEKNRKIIDKVDKKVINKKSSNLVKVLRRKTNILCIRLQLREVGFKSKIRA